MQNPKEDIVPVIRTLTSTVSAPSLAHTITTNFTPDASFRHPLCCVEVRPGSREDILGIYEWYRIMSPKTKSEVLSVIYDPDLNVLIIEVVQYFHLRFTPFEAAPSHLMIRLSLIEKEGKYYIAHQEDFFHPTDITNLVIPPLTPLIKFGLVTAAFVSNVNARIFQFLGLSESRDGGGLQGKIEDGIDGSAAREGDGHTEDGRVG
ncbi:hypothetical protein SERLA73DRAFT_184511 [Serpula lacrymans var. lacrymans S7.3]|uniref:SigF-like NTF2-like domain-containing protein n=2 Tax=Serpula lacrymans var. lacrymans TaxID=341189 RepID=F8Q3E2_SERL3|nr:uncharacterized protein SERLADRAFT_472227 [Serpula lacrymans var. lacrymans S7.9]EGN97703.1 hypothetical protein SERLA73DRAFT_184511 [Serpula lacrymans var. lacrymans S7.3]EGO23294.1 hypothetical protein SERLADRAFT_472227 [Serpula lacrymans var. lacrymans S7.9]